MMKKFIFVLISAILYLSSKSIVFAQGEGEGPSQITLDNPLKYGTIPELIEGIMSWLITLGAPIATGMVIYGALQILFAGGSEEKFATGKKTILYAVVGYAILILSFGIASIIKQLLQ